jgi:hypothetical protein
MRTLLDGSQKLDAVQKRPVLRAVVARVDIEAEQRRVVLPRDVNGKIVGKGGERWAVGRIRLRLSLAGSWRGWENKASAERSSGHRLSLSTAARSGLAWSNQVSADPKAPGTQL